MSKWGEGSIDGEKEEGGECRGMKEAIKISYIHVPTPHKECKYYALQTCTNKKKKK